jgi:hypothetical protein
MNALRTIFTYQRSLTFYKQNFDHCWLEELTLFQHYTSIDFNIVRLMDFANALHMALVQYSTRSSVEFQEFPNLFNCSKYIRKGIRMKRMAMKRAVDALLVSFNWKNIFITPLVQILHTNKNIVRCKGRIVDLHSKCMSHDDAAPTVQSEICTNLRENYSRTISRRSFPPTSVIRWRFFRN